MTPLGFDVMNPTTSSKLGRPQVCGNKLPPVERMKTEPHIELKPLIYYALVETVHSLCEALSSTICGRASH